MGKKKRWKPWERRNEQLREIDRITLLDNRVLSEQIERDKWLSSKGERLELAEKLIEKGYPADSSISFLKCGDKSGVEFLQRCKKDPSHINLVEISHHCSLRSCPKCSKRLQRRFFNKWYDPINDLPFVEGFKTRFLTISPINVDTQEKGVEICRKGWKRFIKTEYYKENIKGGLYVIEIVRNWVGKPIKDKYGKILGYHDKISYHVHPHIVIYSKWLENQIKEENGFTPLKNALDKSFRCSVFPDIKLIAEDERKGLRNRKILNYMLQYIGTLESDFEGLDDKADYIIFTRKKRLVSPFGIFYKYKFEKKKCHCKICGGDIDIDMDKGNIENYKRERKDLKTIGDT